jgi:hypothetical protein
MNQQESQLLQSFLDQLVQVRGITKDRDADAMIARALSQQPDAAYLLTQRALLQDQALEAAQARIVELERQAAAPSAPAAASSFLSGGGWGRRPQAASTPAVETSVTGRPLPANRMAAVPPAASAGFGRATGGGFLPTMAATAAGVIGGAFLFQGIQHLMNSGASAQPAGNAAADASAAAPAIEEQSFADSSQAAFDDGGGWDQADADAGDDFA